MLPWPQPPRQRGVLYTVLQEGAAASRTPVVGHCWHIGVPSCMGHFTCMMLPWHTLHKRRRPRCPAHARGRAHTVHLRAHSSLRPPAAAAGRIAAVAAGLAAAPAAGLAAAPAAGLMSARAAAAADAGIMTSSIAWIT
jgi:hypothetical protein